MTSKLQKINDLLFEAEEIWDEISEEILESSEGDLLAMAQYVNSALPNVRLNFEDIQNLV